MNAGRHDVTLGVFAGGRATRLGGRDKAWMQRDGEPQVVRLAHAFAMECAAVVVSANRALARYHAHGLVAIPDRMPHLGPLGGLDALAAACTTPWLLTIPVDVINVDAGTLQALMHPAGQGAVACDDDGLQPLIALYRVNGLRVALEAALQTQQYAVRDLQAKLGLQAVRFPGIRFGNLNTPEDLLAAGMTHSVD